MIRPTGRATARIAMTAALLFAAGAHAHSDQERTEPADGAMVAGVETMTIRFDAPMRVTAIKLMRDGREMDVARETGMEPVTEFRAAPAEPLAPGAYAVEWRGLSADGHPMQGAFGFTVSE